METASRLGNQLKEAIAAFERIATPCALIGGLALATHKVVRATRGVDLLTDGRQSDGIDQALVKLGYHCLQRSLDAGNYLRGDERLDLLYATRPLALRLLVRAPMVETAFGEMQVISAEGLIAFKLQGWVNNPRRAQDLEDIRALIRTNLATLDRAELREYFSLNPDPELAADQPLFGSGGVQTRPTIHGDPYEALDDLMVVVERLCPVWPTRELFKSEGLWLL